jgi:hypothetical protein
MTWQYGDDPLPFDVRTCVHVNELLCPAVEETGRILNTFLPNGFPEPAPQAVNCRCVCLTGKPTKHPRYKIVIECAADSTFATMYVDDNVVKMESAKRNPADKFNWRIGAQTAFNRLWEKKKPKKPVNKYAQLFNEKLMECAKEEVEKIFRRFDKLPPAVREAERHAKPGEWVKIVKADGYPDETYKTGDVLKVKSLFFSESVYDGWVYLEGHEECACAPCEYVVLEGYKPE